MKIKIDKKAKLMLLDAMKTGYLEATDLSDILGQLSEDDARTFITVWALKLDGLDPFRIPPITGAVFFGDEKEEEEYKRREKDLADREKALLDFALQK